MLICKNCHSKFTGNYCSHCGQKNYTDKDKSVKHLLEEVLHFITHFEGSFFSTLKAVFFHPGKLSNDYNNGIRKKYYKPVSLYLVIVVIYLIFPFFSGLNMEMKTYKSMPFTGHFISQQIIRTADRLKLSEAQLAEQFKEKSHSTSKILLFLFIPFSAILIFVLYFRKKALWFDHLILATEINIYYLLAFYLVAPLFLFLVIAVFGNIPVYDEVLGLFLTFLFGLYSSFVFHSIFQSKWWQDGIKGMGFAFFHSVFILAIYKLLVFEVTLYLVQ